MDHFKGKMSSIEDGDEKTEVYKTSLANYRRNEYLKRCKVETGGEDFSNQAKGEASSSTPRWA